MTNSQRRMNTSQGNQLQASTTYGRPDTWQSNLRRKLRRENRRDEWQDGSLHATWQSILWSFIGLEEKRLINLAPHTHVYHRNHHDEYQQTEGRSWKTRKGYSIIAPKRTLYNGRTVKRRFVLGSIALLQANTWHWHFSRLMPNALMTKACFLDTWAGRSFLNFGFRPARWKDSIKFVESQPLRTQSCKL